jgi:hypothetical protein
MDLRGRVALITGASSGSDLLQHFAWQRWEPILRSDMGRRNKQRVHSPNKFARWEDRPIVMPPRSCERAVFGLMMRPAAKMPSSRGMRTSPLSRLTRTSANCAPKAYMANHCASGFSPPSPVASSPSTGMTPCSSCRRARSLRAASTIAVPHEPVPIEPPTICAGGSNVSPISRCTRSSGTSSASTAICVRTVHAAVPISAASMRIL